ncbi:translation initiation factor IF-2-like [Ischnura elegans]|uniref:translation initiation factor IF-2-like n=1 Tax=Ischnura elegans TaxID=197161 RepID=UPI001ED87829|nr:translation initiation factor IF-2-like [Ischnura elegans]
MDEGASERTTQLALLFPLKASLFPAKSPAATSPKQPESPEMTSPGSSQPSPLTHPNLACPRLRLRRGSSLSDLTTLQQQQAGPLEEISDCDSGPPSLMPPREGGGYPGGGGGRLKQRGCDTAPQSPATGRRGGMTGVGGGSGGIGRGRRLFAGDEMRGGSIGDLMNLKQYGSVWSVRSATESIAEAVPLATVTPRTPRKGQSPNRAAVGEGACPNELAAALRELQEDEAMAEEARDTVDALPPRRQTTSPPPASPPHLKKVREYLLEGDAGPQRPQRKALSTYERTQRLSRLIKEHQDAFLDHPARKIVSGKRIRVSSDYS